MGFESGGRGVSGGARVLRNGLGALLLTGMATACAGTPDATADTAPATAIDTRPDRPDWLDRKIQAFRAMPPREAPIKIWQFPHGGKPAYLFISPCCDQFNPLFDAVGALLCHPSGGIAGRGDGKCPAPQDPGTKAVLIWANPAMSGTGALPAPFFGKP